MLSRIELWKFIFQTSVEPQLAIFGRGVGVLNADSLYITYLSEFGYPGMLLIIGIFLYFIKNGFTLLDTARSTPVIVIARAVVIMDIVFGIISITGSHINSFPGDTYFWFWNGVATGLWRAQTQANRSGTEHEDLVDT